MSPPHVTMPAPGVSGNGHREVLSAWARDNFLDTNSKPKTQARMHAEKAWAKVCRKFQVVRRRPRTSRNAGAA